MLPISSLETLLWSLCATYSLSHMYVRTYVCTDNCEGPSAQRLQDAGNFGTDKSVLELTCSHNHPAAFERKIDRLERSRKTMAAT